MNFSLLPRKILTEMQTKTVPEHDRNVGNDEHFPRRAVLLVINADLMLNRIMISVAVGVALVAAPVASAARSCILVNAATQKACQPPCCANKTCCAASPKNTAPPSQPLAKADSGQQVSATCFATAALPFSSFEGGAEQFRFHVISLSAHSPPQLALLCTLLI
jgi:hypothetical protein